MRMIPRFVTSITTWLLLTALMYEIAGGRGLTHREEEVVELVGRGLTNSEIAQNLGLSPWTIKRHVARVLAKTGDRRRIDLAVRHARRTEE